MWYGKATEESYKEMCSMSCENHKSTVNTFPGYDKLVKKKKEIFWTMKTLVMDPFLFYTESNPTVEDWIGESNLLLENRSVIQFSFEVTHELKEKLVVIDSISTFVLANLLSVCCKCDDLRTVKALLKHYFQIYYNLSENHATTLEKSCLKDALQIVSKLTLYDKVRTNFEDCDEDIRLLAFLLSYYHFLDLCHDPEISISCLEEIFTDVPEDEKCFNVKKRGNAEFKKQNYNQAINIYSEGIKSSCYSHILYGNRAQALLRLDRYDEAELDSRATIILHPAWSKGYYRLSQSQAGLNRIHAAHTTANFGMQMCNACPILHELRDMQENECETCILLKAGQAALDNSAKDAKISESPTDDKEHFSDVPELTDSSSYQSSEEDGNVESNKSDCELLDVDVFNTTTEELIEDKPTLVEEIPIRMIKTKKMEEPNQTDYLFETELREMENSNQMKRIQVESSIQTEDMDEPSQAEDHLQDNKSVFESLLRNGYMALVHSNTPEIAKQNYFEALSHVKAGLISYDFDDLPLRYVYGVACSKSSNFEDLNKAIVTFKDIISKTQYQYPCALYELALVYYKMNNFMEALILLKTFSWEEFPTKRLKTLMWPGEDIVIKESQPEHLRALFAELRSQCENPPLPDARCRYGHCTLQPVIYLTDPEFKGFILIECQEHCILQYHVPCWKYIKDSLDKSDKEFLDSACMTPDCEGLITKVETIGKSGMVEKSFETEERKLKKNLKLKKSKSEKKFQMKELRKKKRNRSISLSESHTTTEEASEPVVERFSCSESAKFYAEGPSCVPKASSAEVLVSDLSPAASSFYVIKKDVELKVPEAKAKHKERKKPKKSTFSIDEFCGDYSKKDISNYNDYQIRLHRLQETKRVVEENEGWHQSQRNQSFSQNHTHHQKNAATAAASVEVQQPYEADPAEDISQSVKDYIYLRFESILQEKGALNIDDPIVGQELQDIPCEWTAYIEECGGFKSFMLQSTQFAIVGEKLCLFAKMLDLYNPTVIDKLEDFDLVYESGPQSVLRENIVGNAFKLEEKPSALNPHAAEYSPSDSGSNLSLGQNDSAGTYSAEQNLCNMTTNLEQGTKPAGLKEDGVKMKANDKSLINRLTMLRQPLSSYAASIETKKDLPAEDCSSSISSKPRSSCDEKLVVKFLTLKSQLTSNTISRDTLDCLHEISKMLNKIEDKNNVVKLLVEWSIRTSKSHRDKCEQAGSPEIVLISRGVMKCDEELNATLKKNYDLVGENTKLLEKQQSLEAQLVSSLDSVAQLQNKYNVEFPVMKKSLTELEILNQTETKKWKTKVTSLEKEIKQWRQKHDLVVEKELGSKKENAKLQVKLNSCNSKIADWTRKCEDYEKKIANQCSILAKCEKVVQDNVVQINEKDAQAELATKRAIKAEVELLQIKKAMYLSRLDSIYNEGNAKIEAFQMAVQSSMPDNVKQGAIMKYLAKIKDFSLTIYQIRTNTAKKADDLISKVQSGILMAQSTEFAFPDLPVFPNLVDEAVINMPTGTAAAPMYAVTNSYFTQNASSTKSAVPLRMPVADSVAMGVNPVHLMKTAGDKMGLLPPGVANVPGANSLMSQIPHFGSQFTNQSANYYSTTIPSSYSFQPHVNAANAATTVTAPPPGITLSKTKLTRVKNGLTPKVGCEATMGSRLVADVQPRTGRSSAVPRPASRNSSTSPLNAESSHDMDGSGSSVASFHSLTSSNSRKKTVPSVASSQVKDVRVSPINNQAAASQKRQSGTKALELEYTDAKSAGDTKALKADPLPNKVLLVLPKTIDKKGGYFRILERLRVRFPQVSDGDLLGFLKQFRDTKVKLSGMTIDVIASGVAEIVERHIRLRPPPPNPISRPKTIVNRPIASNPVPEPPKVVVTTNQNPWGKPPATKVPLDWNEDDDEKNCIICLEDMFVANWMRVECGHKFHVDCIKRWLDKTSNCPVCRVHLLLPEDYPVLH